MEIRIVPNMISVTIFGQENQSMRLLFGFYIVDGKFKISKKGIWGNRCLPPEWLWHCSDNRKNKGSKILDPAEHHYRAL
jgi:hypothetical protein